MNLATDRCCSCAGWNDEIGSCGSFLYSCVTTRIWTLSFNSSGITWSVSGRWQLSLGSDAISKTRQRETPSEIAGETNFVSTDVTTIPSYLRPWNSYFRCWTPRHSVGPQKCRWHKSWIAGVIFPNPSFLWHPHPVINIVRVISERLHNSAWFSTRPMGYIIHEDQFVIFKFQGGQDYDDWIFLFILAHLIDDILPNEFWEVGELSCSLMIDLLVCCLRFGRCCLH